jgi:hypothetical protein
LAQKPEYVDALVGLASSQFASNEFDGAIVSYQKLVSLKPGKRPLLAV